MKNSKLVLPVLMLMAVTLSCKLLNRTGSKKVSNAPAIDFSTPGKSLNVTVQLDKKQTASTIVPRTGGSVSLTAKDGSKFKLDVPADALDADTTITMTAVKSLDGAPLDNNTPTAVQLEPSGLFFKDMATLTIVPGKDIPIKQQIIFGYEGDGKDYHLAVVDPKSKEIKIKLMQFSGAGVGSGSDSAWAANLMTQASTAQTRLSQKLGEFLQVERRVQVLGEVPQDDTPFGDRIASAMDQYEDQVIRKEIAAAELDCKHARRAMQDILGEGRQRQLLGFKPDPEMWEKIDKLAKIAAKCLKPFRVSGESNGVKFSGQICSLDKPFVIDATFPGGGSAKTSFTPGSVISGATSVSGGGGECVQSGGGQYNVTIKEDGSGTITWTTTDTLTCPEFSNTRSGSFTLPLQPAPEISCP
ncbi:MAG: hypothetical protein M3R67_14955 [Acidobacteriota bacterium]|nr:hypothetical protein [Acidobacteriota bacterium]